MSANPLKRASEPAVGSSEAHLMGICIDYNRRCKAIGWPRWYYVDPAKDDKKPEIRTVEGIEAEEVWNVLAGRKIDYYAWPAHKLEKVERRARWLAERGGA